MLGASQVALVVKNPPATAGDISKHRFNPWGPGKFPGEGNGNPLQYSCLENPMDRGTLQVTVLRVAKIRTQLNRLSTHTRVQKQRQNFTQEYGKRISRKTYHFTG